MKRFVAAAGLSLLLTASCMGPNEAFGGIHEWNREIEGRWTRQLVHAAFWVVPVYPIALLADIVIFNSIEFWGGDSPMEDQF